MSAPGPRHSLLVDPLPLVGRTRELAELENLLEPEQSANVVFLRGEGGVGKSRLAAELAERAERRSWDIVRGRAYPVEQGVPYAVFSDAWLPRLKSMDPSRLAVLSRGGEAELQYLFPALGDHPPGVRDAYAAEPDELLTRLMWTFAEFTKRLASRQPLLCILEDLQWADESSLRLLHFLARNVVGEPIVLLCTYNDQERDQSRALIDTERSLESIGAGSVMQLSPLSQGQVQELVSRAFATDPAVVRDFGTLLYGWTRGNAFFAEEILKALVASGRLSNQDGTWIGWDARDYDLPGSIRDAIMSRVGGLSEAARVVVELAAVVGSRAPHSLLESVSGLSEPEVLAGLEALCGAGILEEHDEPDEVVYDFRHPLVRQTLYAELSRQRLRILHRSIGEAMESRGARSVAANPDELAFHFARSDGAGLQAKAARYLAAAGKNALDRRADGEAISYFETAMQRLSEAPEEDRARQLTAIRPDLARAKTHVGAFDEAVEIWHAVLSETSEDNPAYPRVCRVLGLNYLWQGKHSEATRYFDQGLDSASATQDAGARVRLLVAKAHGYHEVGRGIDALKVLQTALPEAEQIGDAHLLARVHRALALLHVWIGPPAAATEHAEQAIKLADEVGDLSIAFWARWGLAVLSGMRGDTARMEAAIDEINAIADDAHAPILRLWTADMSVELTFAQGDWDAGLARAEQAISLARSLGQRTLLPRLLVWTSQFHVGRADLERAEELVQEAVAISGLNDESGPVNVHQVVPTYIGLAHYLVHLGDYDDAIEAAEKGLRIAEGTGYTLWAMHQLLPVLAEACLWAGHIDKAEEVGQRMRAHADRIDHRLGRAWADATDALVRWKRGDTPGAIDGMRAAADELDSIPMMWSATRLRRQLAGRLAEVGRREEALAELGVVHSACVSVRAGLELEKTRAMYRELGVRPPSVGGDGGPLGLTPAEARVAVFVADGKSNKAIAAELRCATRTVSTHLSNIYAKLEIGGPGARMRLGNLARDAGMLD